MVERRFSDLEPDDDLLSADELRQMDLLLSGELKIEDSFLAGREGRPNQVEDGQIDRLLLGEGRPPERVIQRGRGKVRSLYLDDAEMAGLERIAYDMDLVRNGRGNVSALMGLIGMGKLIVTRRM